jgi:hypothetical protein
MGLHTSHSSLVVSSDPVDHSVTTRDGPDANKVSATNRYSSLGPIIIAIVYS